VKIYDPTWAGNEMVAKDQFGNEIGRKKLDAIVPGEHSCGTFRLWTKRLIDAKSEQIPDECQTPGNSF
jgi:hypothetical protein